MDCSFRLIATAGYCGRVDEVLARIETAEERFPKEAKGIAALFQKAKFVEDFVKPNTSYQTGESGSGTEPSIEDFLKFKEYCELPVSKFIARHVKDPALIMIYTQLAAFLGTEPDQLSTALFLTMWNGYHRHGFYNFVGGSQAVSNALAAVIKENGGVIRTNTLATKITIKDGKATMVKTENDICYRPQYVISNASTPATMYDLIGKEHLDPADIQKYKEWTTGLSLLVVYLGVDHDYRDVFKNTHEIMISDLLDPNENFNTVFTCDAEKANMTIANYTMLDPTSAPEGKNVIEISAQFSYDCDEQWGWDTSHEAYKKHKLKYAGILVRRAEKYLPNLSKHIEFLEVGSPQTMRHFTLNPRGTIFGWDATIDQSMLNRMDTNKLKGISNLYLAGAWTFPCGGQSAVMWSGVYAAQAILQPDKESVSSNR